MSTHPLQVDIQFAGYPVVQYPSRKQSIVTSFCHLPISVFSALLQCCPAYITNNLQARVSINMPEGAPMPPVAPVPMNMNDAGSLRQRMTPLDLSSGDGQAGSAASDLSPKTPDSAYGDGRTLRGAATTSSPTQVLYGNSLQVARDRRA